MYKYMFNSVFNCGCCMFKCVFHYVAVVCFSGWDDRQVSAAWAETDRARTLHQSGKYNVVHGKMCQIFGKHLRKEAHKHMIEMAIWATPVVHIWYFMYKYIVMITFFNLFYNGGTRMKCWDEKFVLITLKISIRYCAYEPKGFIIVPKLKWIEEYLILILLIKLIFNY